MSQPLRRAERQPLDREVLVTALGPGAGRWQRIDVFDTLESTNAAAARDGEAWTVVCADHQTAGRGRLGRRWEAPPRSSIAVSAVVPASGAPSPQGWLPLLTGMAMSLAVRRPVPATVREGLEPMLKWPNDILLQELSAPAGLAGLGGSGSGSWRKLGGVLCELLPGDARRPSLLVTGVGINVDQSHDELPVEHATSLRLCGQVDVRREEVISRYLTSLVGLHADWASGGQRLDRLRESYRRMCLTIGSQVRIDRPGGPAVEGLATDVDDHGRLLLQTPQGLGAHAAGDVVHLRSGAGDTREESRC